MENEAICIINETWQITKTKLSAAVEGAKSTLGKKVQDLEKMLKEMMKVMEKIVNEFVKMIREYCKMALDQLTALNKEYLK